MIKHKGDLTKVTKGVVVHGCNAQGVMGSGVAKAVRDTWPEAYAAYKETHVLRGLKVGDTVSAHINENLVVVNAITQEYYGTDGRLYLSYGGLVECFQEINASFAEYKSLHFPLIGAGLAGGKWEVIKELIEECVTDMELNLWVL
ncbi:MAG: hypothetical protein GY810_01190 [Aureispira sp.]|nr:hypothetical protein [Aureispira sp.]